MRSKEKITISELSKMLKLSDTVVRTHLCCFDKYRIPYTRPVEYRYNYPFLLQLRDFYYEKSESISKKYKSYKDIVARLDKIINLWNKINRVKKH